MVKTEPKRPQPLIDEPEKVYMMVQSLVTSTAYELSLSSLTRPYNSALEMAYTKYS